MKPRITRWARHMARMAERTGACRVLVGKPEEKRHLEDLGVGGSLVLKWIFEKWDKAHGLD
jgi:hypothetical protein